MKKPYYITTPIYYSSGKLHLGHCYTTVFCDAVARFKRMAGFDVFYLTGTDEHGQKVQEVSAKANQTPKQFVDALYNQIVELWNVLDIKYDKFIRTTDKYHEQAVQKIFKKLFEQGDLYKSEYEGLYCTPCESFWTESQLVEGKCPDCGRAVQLQKEESYFFKLSKYADRLLELYNSHPEFIAPTSRMNEMVNNFIKPGLKDLCVSRTSFSWGVPVDFDPKHVVYVWIDALSNYITALGYNSDDTTLFEKFWPADLHVVGKEITRFHTIIWPALLMALDLPLPKTVYGHGWINFYGDKMSKSKGNVAYPLPLIERFGVDAVRYYLLSELQYGGDGNYSDEGFLERINTDLCNSLGNLVSRTTAMITQYFDGVVQQPNEFCDIDKQLIDLCEQALEKVTQRIDAFELPESLAEIFKIVDGANKYIDQTSPWALNKNDRERLKTVLYCLAESIRFSAVLLAPFVPTTAGKILHKLGMEQIPQSFDSVKKFGELATGTKVNKGENLFDRIDIKKELPLLAEIMKNQLGEKPQEDSAKNKQDDKKSATSNLINIDDFAKVELCTAKILSAKKAENSDRLLVFEVEVGNQTRQVVSGIAEHYTPEYMVGKTVVLVKNLAPAKIRGIESNGMILCVDAGNSVVFVTPEKQVDSGKKVR